MDAQSVKSVQISRSHIFHSNIYTIFGPSCFRTEFIQPVVAGLIQTSILDNQCGMWSELIDFTNT